MPMPGSDDEFIPTRTSLLRRLKNWDDQESWKEFFDTYWKMLYSVAKRSVWNDADAQDIVQETIAAVAKRMPDFNYDPAIGSFKSWLVIIIRRRIIDFGRKHRHDLERRKVREPASATGGTEMIARIPDPSGEQIDAIYEEEWKEHIFVAALKRVKQKVSYEQFQMFDCYAVKGWPVEKVAQLLNTTPSAVYSAKYRVTQAIKEEAKRLEDKML
jgi:RNA polymerase sigma-70 factor (ECF subfamily)